MRLRRASALVLTFQDEDAVVHNFLARTKVAVSGATMDLLRRLDGFMDVNDVAALVAADERGRDTLRILLECEVLLLEGTDAEARDAEYRSRWRWGSAAGFYHFVVRDAEYLPGAEQQEVVRAYRDSEPSPPLLRDNHGLETTGLPEFSAQDDFFSTMKRRESLRRFAQRPLPLQVLADCLYAGNGVKRIDNAGVFGSLPKTMTPSGGARNPFELFVHVQRASGVAPGVYHYSACDHDLGLVCEDPVSPASCLGGQGWADRAAAMVYLVADMSRTAWKYRQAVSYRVILMEAGFIAQNILLAATRHGAGGTPSAALAESRIETMCRCDSTTQAAIMAVALGFPED